MQNHGGRYGGFNARYLGVTLEIDSGTTWDLVTRHILGNEPVDVDALAGLPEPELARQVYVLTALSHEVRHFHDFLLSPEGASIARTRMATTINAVQVPVMVEQLGLFDGITHIPTPLSLWWGLTTGQQAAAERRWSQLSERWGKGPISVPRLSISNPEMALDGLKTRVAGVDVDSFAALIDIVDASYRRLAQYMFGEPLQSPEGKRFENRHVLEASAAIVQVQWAYTTLGVDAAELLMNELAGRSTYGLAFNLVYEAAQLGGASFESPFQPMSALLNWALIGQHRSEDVAGTPARRLARLVGCMLENGQLTYSDDLRATYRRWDDMTDEPDTFEQLEKSLELDGSWVRKVRDLRKRTDLFIRPFLDLLISWTEAFCKARHLMVGRFLEAPQAYVFPYDYIHGLDRFVAPPLEVRWTDGGLVGTKKAVERAGWVLHDWAELPERPGNLLMRAAGVPASLLGEALVDRQLAHEARELFVTLDVLLSRTRGTISAEDERRAARGLGVQARFIDATSFDIAPPEA